jgi:hypothetical protein
MRSSLKGTKVRKRIGMIRIVQVFINLFLRGTSTLLIMKKQPIKLIRVQAKCLTSRGERSSSLKRQKCSRISKLIKMKNKN